jgi:hypothetical protein
MSFILSFTIIIILLLNYNPFSFNDINILISEANIKNLLNNSTLDKNIFNLYKLEYSKHIIELFEKYIIIKNPSEFYILGFILYKHFSIYIIFIAIMLFIATIVSIMLCSTLYLPE